LLSSFSLTGSLGGSSSFGLNSTFCTGFLNLYSVLSNGLLVGTSFCAIGFSFPENLLIYELNFSHGISG
jgi:hypothetical protein